MSEDLEIRKRRLEKLEFLESQGVNPYAYSFNKKHNAGDHDITGIHQNPSKMDAIRWNAW